MNALDKGQIQENQRDTIFIQTQKQTYRHKYNKCFLQCPMYNLPRGEAALNELFKPSKVFIYKISHAPPSIEDNRGRGVVGTVAKRDEGIRKRMERVGVGVVPPS